MSNDTTRPGGWVNGIGWVALLSALPSGTSIRFALGDDGPDAGVGITTGLATFDHTPVIVTRWADGTTPTEPAPNGLEPGEIVAVPADLKALADEIEAQLTPLPDGVYAKGDELWVAEGFPLDPAAWQHHFPYGGKQPWRTPTGSAPVSVAGPILVRRTPAEPPAPPTEDVPWWEALRDERLLPGDLGTRCISTGFVGGRRWVGEGDAVGSYLNPDGTVTVQAQGVES